jgi:hypothetical protein
VKSVNNIVVDSDGIATDEKEFHFKWTKQMFHASLESRGLVFEMTGVSSEFSQYCKVDSWINPRVAIFATYCYLSNSPPVDRRAEQACSVQGVLLVSCYRQAARGLTFILDIPVLAYPLLGSSESSALHVISLRFCKRVTAKDAGGIQ